MTHTPKLPLTALVVTYNEAHLLKRSLKSLAFCREIIVINLNSVDDSAELAKEMGATVINHPRVPVVEQVKHIGIKAAQYDWVLSIDPDEEVTPALAADIAKFMSSPHTATTSVVEVPWIFYFKKHALRGTVWGGRQKHKRVLFNRARTRVDAKVHAELAAHDATYGIYTIKIAGDNVLRHHWMQGWQEFIEKHWRYIKLEGEARYERGERLRPKYLLRELFLYRFYESLFRKQGYKDGWLGVVLSFFWACYNLMSLFSLISYHYSKRKHQPVNK